MPTTAPHPLASIHRAKARKKLYLALSSTSEHIVTNAAMARFSAGMKHKFIIDELIPWLREQADRLPIPAKEADEHFGMNVGTVATWINAYPRLITRYDPRQDGRKSRLPVLIEPHRDLMR